MCFSVKLYLKQIKHFLPVVCISTPKSLSLLYVHFEIHLIWSLCPCSSEVLYEDLQYLFISALALACLAALLMLGMWLLNKAYKRIVAWRRRKQMPGKKIYIYL